MAEAAGLAVGVVSLAVSFKACIDLFDCFYVAYKQVPDLLILVTKLDVERYLLLQWGKEAGLCDDADNSHISDFGRALPIFDAIKLLLSDGQKLRERYHLQTYEEHRSDEYCRCSSGISQPRLQDLTNAFSRLNVDPSLLHSGLHTSTEKVAKRASLNRLRWAVHDKEKFSELVDNLSYFVSRLREIFPVKTNYTPQMYSEDLALIESTATLGRIQTAAEGRNTVLAEAAESRRHDLALSQLLSSLWFRWKRDRYSQLSSPTPKTFRWALSEQRSPSGWSSLPQFLKTPGSIYWINGKPAAGKSTLMKFIFDHEKTRQYLGEWTGNNKLTIAGFFFYHVGTEEQKSQSGLLRSLLHDVLQADHSLASELLPDTWREACSLEQDQRLTLPSQTEMLQAFRSLARLNGKDRKFCLFIDGLDEFSGNLMDIVALVKDVAQASHIKLVIASRPLQPCVVAFSKYPQLRLQDLTHDDMMEYVEQNLIIHPYMKKLQGRDAPFAAELQNELVRKSSGVFLWLVIVCRTLLEGFGNFDRPHELEERIADLPVELTALFEHMLNKIDRYQAYAILLLRICENSSDLGSGDLDVLSFAVADDHEFDAMKLDPSSSRDRSQDHDTCLAFEARLRSRCCGLLEIDYNPRSVPAESSDSIDKDLGTGTVTFVHRSLLEYMQTCEFLEAVNRRQFKLGSHPDPRAALACVLFQKATATGLHENTTYGQRSRQLFLASLNQVPSSVLPTLRNLCLLLGHYQYPTYDFVDGSIANRDAINGRHLTWFRNAVVSETSAAKVALLIAIETGFVELFRAVWEYHGRPELSSQSLGSAPLWHAIRRPYLDTWCAAENKFPSKSMIRSLLSAGVDVNDRADPGAKHSAAGQITPWKELLHMARIPQTLQVQLQYDLEIFQLFLDNGANLEQGRTMVAGTLSLLKHNSFKFCEAESEASFRQFWDCLARRVDAVTSMSTAPRASPGTAGEPVLHTDSRASATPPDDGLQRREKRKAFDELEVAEPFPKRYEQSGRNHGTGFVEYILRTSGV